MADSEDPDAGLTEDQMLFEAIALSMQQSSSTGPQRSVTNQSEDSLLSAEVRGEELRQQSSQGHYHNVTITHVIIIASFSVHV